jgi:methylmalonyl-CoA epimerase
MITQIDHLGIAVHRLDVAVPLYEKVLGLKCERIEEVPSQQVRTAFFNVGQVHLELLEPTSDTSPVAKFLRDRGEGVHHVAFAAENIVEQLAHAREGGARLINESPVPGAGGKQVAFLHPKSTLGVLMELCSPAEK